MKRDCRVCYEKVTLISDTTVKYSGNEPGGCFWNCCNSKSQTALALCVWKATKRQDNGDVWARWKAVGSKFKEVTGAKKLRVSFSWLYELEILIY